MLNFTLVFDEGMGLLFSNGQKLTWNNVKSFNFNGKKKPAFTIINGEKVERFKEQHFNKFRDSKQPLMVVQDGEGKVGIIPVNVYNPLRNKK